MPLTGVHHKTANGAYASVTGGIRNDAYGEYSSVRGGQDRMIDILGQYDWKAGPLHEDY